MVDMIDITILEKSTKNLDIELNKRIYIQEALSIKTGCQHTDLHFFIRTKKLKPLTSSFIFGQSPIWRSKDISHLAQG